MKPLEKLFWEEVSEMLHVEGMLAKSLLRMHGASSSEPVKELFTAYRTSTEQNLADLGKLLRSYELPVREKKCDCMMGLLLKAQQGMQRLGSGATTDAFLVGICRKAITVKVASYEALTAWAKLLTDGAAGPVKTFDKILKEESQADSKFKRLAAKADAQAAAQNEESPRKAAPPKRQPEVSEARRWGTW
jgi:ferritin-like metal-binding protein YciE